ncbi:hypothetical protein JOD57_000030 [Geodermatophilus bullaregiensis]|uniref:hypothetical protein n=1 Tax=Geodermatophilus bullaregiensis TaxID=1564160 RepID=UPI00195EAFAA|nr:hypothetical protein [Geodermatophilus bullaregiensis]MBM7804193.1 hypothetical protein [Geodermatophilus bullaregiensis]
MGEVLHNPQKARDGRVREARSLVGRIGGSLEQIAREVAQPQDRLQQTLELLPAFTAPLARRSPR